jgi:phage gp29-like protein
MAKKNRGGNKGGKGGNAGAAAAANPPGQLIAGFDKDTLTKQNQGLLKPSDATLAEKGSGKGLAIYDDIERDCHAYAVLQKRKLAVVSFPWEVDPATDAPADAKAADGIREMLDATDLDGLSLGLLDAVLKGFAVSEVEWDPDTWAPLRFHQRDQRRFLFDSDCNPRLITPENRQEGIQLPERKFIIHRFGAKDGNPYGLGLGTRLYWPAWFKRHGMHFWAQFAEKFGGPTVIGKCPPEMGDEKRETLLQALGRTSQETAIVVDLDAQVELLEGTRSGSVDTYDKFIRYMDEEMSKTVLGETLTTSIGDTGSFAAAQTHNGVRMELSKADADLLSATLNSTLLTWLTEFHFPGANPPRLWRRVEVPKDEKAEADKDLVVFQLGFAPDEEFIQKKYGDGWHARGGFAPGPDMDIAGAQPPPGAPEGAGEGPEGGPALPDAPAGAQAAESGVVVQDTALNGAQVASLLQVLGMAATGTLPKESATQVIKAAFPGVPDQLVAGMINPIEVKAPEPTAPAPNLPAASGVRAAPDAPKPKAEFAEPKKTWLRGLLPFAPKQPKKEQDDIDILADKAEAASAEAMDALMEPVRRLVAGAASFEEVMDGLLDAYPEMDTKAYQNVLKDALVASHLVGAAKARNR